MTLSVKHAKVVASTDSGDGKVSSNAWNDEHVLKGTAGQLVGFGNDGFATEIDPRQLSSIFVNVKDAAYGATGDGVTDDSTAIQSAINAIVALGGGTLYFPYGTYLLNTGLLLTLAVDGGLNVRLQGGAGTFLKTTSAIDILTISNTNVGAANTRRATIDGLGFNTLNAAARGLVLTKASYNQFTNLDFIGYGSALVVGNGVTDIYTVHNQFSNIRITQPGNGLKLGGLYNIVTNLVVGEGITGQYAIQIDGAYCIVSGFAARGAGGSGGTAAVVLAGTAVGSILSNGTVFDSYAIGVEAAGQRQIKVIGVTIVNSQTHGLRLNGCYEGRFEVTVEHASLASAGVSNHIECTNTPTDNTITAQFVGTEANLDINEPAGTNNVWITGSLPNGKSVLGTGSTVLSAGAGKFGGAVSGSNLSGTNTGDQDLSGLLVKSNNLSDLPNAATALTNLGAAPVRVATTTQTGTAYTVALTDANSDVRFTNASAVTVTIPPNSSVAFPTDTAIGVIQAGTGAVSIAAGVGVTINSPSGLDLAGQYSAVGLKKIATDTWLLTGDLAGGGASLADGDYGDITVGGSGTTMTIDANTVTLSKLANAAASSKLVGSGASGSGASYSEITLGTNLSMSGTTLNASGGGQSISYVSGNWYSPPAFGASFSTGPALAANTARFVQVYFPTSVTVTDLAVRVTTAGTTLQLALYNNNNGRPGTEITHTGNITATTTGNKTITLGANATVPAGYAWLGINSDNAAAVVTSFGNVIEGHATVGSATLANVLAGNAGAAYSVTTTLAFGTWGDLTSATWAEQTTAGPAVFLKAA